MKALIFPCNTLEAIVKAKELKLAGHEVIGATSVVSEYHLDASSYEQVFQLPHLTAEDFVQQFIGLLTAQQIEFVWSSIPSVNTKLQSYTQTLPTQVLSAPPVPLYQLPIAVMAQQVNATQRYLERLQQSFNLPEVMSSPMLTNILTATFKVPGESHFDKIFTLSCLFSTVPECADIVEIGSLWGRTAKAFCCLSQYFNKGNVLCIDPWTHGEEVTQNVHSILDDMSRVTDGDGHFAIFVANLVAEHRGKVNYIRGYSSDVIEQYAGANNVITTAEFATTEYQQQIGLLHIDGNHKYENVVADISNYAHRVIAGGWVVFDDYNWAYGDGVTKAADGFLIANRNRIEVAFFCGGALFVQIKK